jgi:hypothetical protein
VLLFQCAFLLLLQIYLWDRVPIFLSVGPPATLQGSFYFAELYKLAVACLLLVPASTVLGLIYPTLQAGPQLEREGNSHLSGHLNAANSLGCLTRALLGVFALIPSLGSELSLKVIALAKVTFGILFVLVAPARQSFAHLNERILDDPQTHLFLEDGRNLLLTNRQRAYDLITIEITNVWFAGATNLYSQEFYELARKRLRPDGVHHIGPREVVCEPATARAVFPYVGGSMALRA